MSCESVSGKKGQWSKLVFLICVCCTPAGGKGVEVKGKESSFPYTVEGHPEVALVGSEALPG